MSTEIFIGEKEKWTNKGTDMQFWGSKFWISMCVCVFFFFCLFFFFFGGGGGQKMNIFGYGDFVDIFRGHHQTGLYLGVISMHFRVFS